MLHGRGTSRAPSELAEREAEQCCGWFASWLRYDDTNAHLAATPVPQSMGLPRKSDTGDPSQLAGVGDPAPVHGTDDLAEYLEFAISNFSVHYLVKFQDKLL